MTGAAADGRESAVLPLLAVIPARAGSKGLPGKNVRPLGGLPLIGHALRCAERVPRIARTVLSTDAPQVADIGRSLGADVPFLRPAALAEDDAPTMPVLRHALAFADAEAQVASSPPYASVLLLEPTSPGRLPEDIDRAIDLLAAHPNADGVVGCSEPHFNPYYVGVVEREGYLAPALPRPQELTRRQDAPRFLRINGAIYLWRAEFVRRAPADWTAGRHLPLTMPDWRAISIDDLHDFQIAEALVERGLLALPWLPRKESP